MEIDPYIDFQICAVRSVDGAGWVIVEIVGEIETIQADLVAMSLVPDSRRQITSGARRANAPSVERLSTDDAFDYIHGTGWTYDERARCWRAPDEAMIPPSIEPSAHPFAVTFHPPDAGWMDTTFTAGQQSVVFALSNVFDPLPSLVTWLEQVAAGENRRFTCDLEGHELAFDLWPHPHGLRVIVAHIDGIGRTEEIDAVIPRDEFVRSFYGALISFWESPDLVDHWREWASYTEAQGVEVDERDYELHPYDLRSRILDRLLAMNAGPHIR